MKTKIILLLFCVLLVILIAFSIQINPRYTTSNPLLSVIDVTELGESTKYLTLTDKSKISDIVKKNEPGIFVYQNVNNYLALIDKNEAITGDMSLEVKHQKDSYLVTEHETDYSTRRVYDYNNLTWGEAKKTKGKKGLSYKLWQVSDNGEKKLVTKEIIEEPEDNKTIIGRKKVYINIDKSKAKALTVEATAYYDTMTATGVKPYKGVIAVDPRVIPYYTKVYIPGYGIATALDTGGAIKGNKIDLFFEDNSEAYVFGRRTITIYILK